MTYYRVKSERRRDVWEDWATVHVVYHEMMVPKVIEDAVCADEETAKRICDDLNATERA